MQENLSPKSEMALYVRLPRESHRRLRVLAAQTDRTVSDIVRELLDTHLLSPSDGYGVVDA